MNMDTTNEFYLVGNILQKPSDDLGFRQVRCENESQVVVASRDQENGREERWIIRSFQSANPDDPERTTNKICFASKVYNNPQMYLGQDGDVANLQPDKTWFIAERLEHERNTFLLLLESNPEKCLTMEHPHDGSNLALLRVPAMGDPPKPKQKWKFNKTTGH